MYEKKSKKDKKEEEEDNPMQYSKFVKAYDSSSEEEGW